MNARFLTAVALGLSLAAAPALAHEAQGGARHMPPNPDKIAAALLARGVVPADATPAELEAAVEAYLSKRLDGRDQANPLARKRLDANEAALDAFAPSDLRGRKLGTAPAHVAPSAPAWKPLDGAGKLLLLLVDFAETPFTWTTSDGTVRTESGPLHNRIPMPDNTYDLWVPDFDRGHFEDMLFTPGGFTFPADAPRYAGERRGSMADFYLAQSYGRYTVTGQAYGWFTVDRPEAYYGDDDEGVGDVRFDLIGDTVAAANAAGAVPWAEYDENGDCVIDHPLFVHAGVDESGGGGAQGTDAIWAHSWDTWVKVADATCANGLDGLYIYNYTIMPEDGGVGVFAHEFGHDLGLPDEYDTIYSGRGESIANWSIMSSGSWLGMPAQTEPSMMSIWARYALGWLAPGDNLAVTSIASLATSGEAMVRLEQSERWGGPGTFNAVRVSLPPIVIRFNTPHSGAMEWWGGQADQIDTTLTRTVDLTGRSSAALTFWTWYDIEPYWDFGFVQVSADGGATWTSAALPGTTSLHDPNAMPEIVAQLPGFTGSSGGWVQKSLDLGPWAGQVVQVRFRYMTDWGTVGAGFFVDDVALVADGAVVWTDGAEAADPAWAASGWTRTTGSSSRTHYYLAEWRNLAPMETPWEGPSGETSILNFDQGLTHAHQFDPYGSTGNPNEPWLYSYNPGLVLWYRDTRYTENWTGYHPGHGFLLVVDAHDQAIQRPPYPGIGAYQWNTHVQSSDAAFSLDPTYELTLGFFGRTRTYAPSAAVPGFDDSHTYWSKVAPDAGAITPRYGLVFRVLGDAADGSAAAIGLGVK
jgi:immune inhibitor A